LRKSDERLSRKSTLNFFLRNPLDAQKERIRTRYDSDVKSSTNHNVTKLVLKYYIWTLVG